MKINKIIAGILSLGIIFSAQTAFFSEDYCKAVNFGDIDIVIDRDALLEKYYEFKLKSDGTYEISKYIYEKPTTGFQPSNNIELPSSYKGKPVTSIGYRAFCTNKFDYITGSVTIPSSITSIGSYAFWMGDFNSCTIPSSVTEIGSGAFDDTPWLENIRKQNPLVIVNNILIDAATVKGDVVLPDGLTAISGFAFYKNADVTGVTIPNSVKAIGTSAFRYCESLEKVNIPSSITEIGEWVFANCENLSTITIPGSVKTIGEFAFYDCQGITEVVIENGVTEIGDWAFSICLSLTDITIPNSVKTIGREAFSEARKLKNIVIPASVESIGRDCFEYAYDLDSVTILNAGCEIYDEAATIPSRTTIYGYNASSAQSYAEKYGRNFTALDQTVTLGDVNADGKIDASDATLVLREYTLLLSGESGNFSDSQKLAANVDGNETIDASDATIILRYYTEALSLTSGTMPDMEEWINIQRSN